MLIQVKKKYREEPIQRAMDIYFVLRDILLKKHKFDKEKEHFWVVILASNNRIKFIDEVSIGNLNQTIIKSREVFRFAILKGAASIIIAHNHPSGNLTPSEQDRKVMKSLSKAGEILGIKVLDSLIISERNYYSFLGESMEEVDQRTT